MLSFLDLILLLALAIFILSRLYNILGQVDEDREKPQKNKALIDMILGRTPLSNSMTKSQDSIAQAEVIDVSEASLTDELKQKLSQLKSIEKDFSLDKFLQGARKAYTMIYSAINSHNLEVLSQLLSTDLYQKIQAQLAEQKEKNQIITYHIINIRNIEVKDVIYNDSSLTPLATITVTIQNNHTYVLKDNLGNILDGSEDRIITSLDQWKFSKTLGQEKTWLLVEK